MAFSSKNSSKDWWKMLWSLVILTACIFVIYTLFFQLDIDSNVDETRADDTVAEGADGDDFWTDDAEGGDAIADNTDDADDTDSAGAGADNSVGGNNTGGDNIGDDNAGPSTDDEQEQQDEDNQRARAILVAQTASNDQADTWSDQQEQAPQEQDGKTFFSVESLFGDGQGSAWSDSDQNTTGTIWDSQNAQNSQNTQNSQNNPSGSNSGQDGTSAQWGAGWAIAWAIPLSWTFTWEGELRSLRDFELLWQERYIQKTVYNSHFAYLWDFASWFRYQDPRSFSNEQRAELIPGLEKMDGSLVAITDKISIQENWLYWDRIWFLNTQQYDDLNKVVYIVFFNQSSDAWFVQIDRDRYYESKSTIQSMFAEWYDR